VTCTAAAERILTQFASWRDRTKTCALHGRDVRALFASLSVRADNGELGGYTRHRLSAEFQFTAWLPANWPALAARLATLDSGQAVSSTATSAMPEGQPLADLAFCQDWRTGVRSFADFSRIAGYAASVAPYLRAGVAAAESFGFCLGYPGGVTSPQHRVDADTRRSVLVLAAQHDPATPRRWAATVAEQIGWNARLFTYQGWGHRVYRQHLPCPDAVVGCYLTGRRLSAPGASCAAVDPRP
jgi:hypothetical protein